MHNKSNVFIMFNLFLWGCYGGALVFLGGAEAPASPSLAPPMIDTNNHECSVKFIRYQKTTTVLSLFCIHIYF